MGNEILYDIDKDRACLFCNATECAYGPVFYGTSAESAGEVCDKFLAWYNENYNDPRQDIPSIQMERYVEFMDLFYDEPPNADEICVEHDKNIELEMKKFDN